MCDSVRHFLGYTKVNRKEQINNWQKLFRDQISGKSPKIAITICNFEINAFTVKGIAHTYLQSQLGEENINIWTKKYFKKQQKLVLTFPYLR